MQKHRQVTPMKIDVSILSFILVLIIAIPVTALRSGTYSIGYEIADLKNQERELYENNLELKAKLAVVQARVYEKHMSQSQLFNQDLANTKQKRSDQKTIDYTPLDDVAEAAPAP